MQRMRRSEKREQTEAKSRNPGPCLPCSGSLACYLSHCLKCLPLPLQIQPCPLLQSLSSLHILQKFFSIHPAQRLSPFLECSDPWITCSLELYLLSCHSRVHVTFPGWRPGNCPRKPMIILFQTYLHTHRWFVFSHSCFIKMFKFLKLLDTHLVSSSRGFLEETLSSPE